MGGNVDSPLEAENDNLRRLDSGSGPEWFDVGEGVDYPPTRIMTREKAGMTREGTTGIVPICADFIRHPEGVRIGTYGT